MANQPKMVPKRKIGPPLGYPCHGSGGFSGCCCLTLNQANHCDEHRTRTKQPATYRKAIAPIVFDWWFLNVVVSLGGLRWVVSSLKKNETDLHRKCLFCSWELVETTHDTLTKQITSHFRFTHMISDRGDILIPSSLSHAPLSRNKICIKLSISIMYMMYICIHTYKSSLLLLSKMLFFAKEMQVFWTYVELLWLWLQYRTPI